MSTTNDKLEPVFNCKVCGECCRGEGGIYLRKEQVGPAADFLGLTSEAFLERYTEPKYGMLALKTDKDGYCLLQDRKKKTCLIHPVKPDMCRDWPFFHGILTHREGFEAAREGCPGISTEATWEDFKAWHRQNIGTMPPKSYFPPEEGNQGD